MLLIVGGLTLIFVNDLNATKLSKYTHTAERLVIFDTDQGVDDGLALLALLKAEKSFRNIKVLAITCVTGNTDLVNVMKNSLRILHDSNRMDVNEITFYLFERLLLHTFYLKSGCSFLCMFFKRPLV